MVDSNASSGGLWSPPCIYPHKKLFEFVFPWSILNFCSVLWTYIGYFFNKFVIKKGQKSLKKCLYKAKTSFTLLEPPALAYPRLKK